jgi:transposase
LLFSGNEDTGAFQQKLVEQYPEVIVFSAQLKQYRAIATRYDQRARNFLSAIYLAAAIIWLN